jgi:hypothetical protein
VWFTIVGFLLLGQELSSDGVGLKPKTPPSGAKVEYPKPGI